MPPLLIGWRILYATLLARLDDRVRSIVLQPLELRALYCRMHSATKPPAEPLSLSQVALRIAMLGGYLDRKHDHPPGPPTIWPGFFSLHEITAMYRVFRPSA